MQQIIFNSRNKFIGLDNFIFILFTDFLKSIILNDRFNSNMKYDSDQNVDASELASSSASSIFFKNIFSTFFRPSSPESLSVTWDDFIADDVLEDDRDRDFRCDRCFLPFRLRP